MEDCGERVMPDTETEPGSSRQKRPAIASNFGVTAVNPGWALLLATQADVLRQAAEHRRAYGDPVTNLAGILRVDAEDRPLLFGGDA